MLELEQIFLGGYFLLEGERIRINQEQLEGIYCLIDRLEPIVIDRAQLTWLKFTNKDNAKGIMLKQSSNSQHFTIQPLEKEIWTIGLGEIVFPTKLRYVHELQRAYFSLLEERLYFDGDEPPKKTAPIYLSGPDELNFSVIVTRSDSNRRYRKHEKTLVFQSAPDYYLLNNAQVLVRSKKLGYAIWEVMSGDLLYVKGIGITEKETSIAKLWMEKNQL